MSGASYALHRFSGPVNRDKADFARGKTVLGMRKPKMLGLI